MTILTKEYLCWRIKKLREKSEMKLTEGAWIPGWENVTINFPSTNVCSRDNTIEMMFWKRARRSAPVWQEEFRIGGRTKVPAITRTDVKWSAYPSEREADEMSSCVSPQVFTGASKSTFPQALQIWLASVFSLLIPPAILSPKYRNCL